MSEAEKKWISQVAKEELHETARLHRKMEGSIIFQDQAVPE